MIQVQVCCGLNCASHGGQELLALLEECYPPASGVRIEPVTCLQCCEDGLQSPVIRIDGKTHRKVSAEALQETLEQLLME
nr:(2Fe-2S) ferredoxin domain-containing protein [uncultured Holophaga sp.]